MKKEKYKLNKLLVRDLVIENGVKFDIVCFLRKRKLINIVISEVFSKKKKYSEDLGFVWVNFGFYI